MRTYYIYHAIEPTFQATLDQKRELVTSLQAANLEDAFKRTQSDMNGIFAKLRIRSTSVGDIICGEGFLGYGYYLVKGVGFEYLGEDFDVCKPVKQQPKECTLKTELAELQVLIEAIANYWDDKRLVTMSVILQNMAFRASNESNWKDFDVQLKILEMNAKYRPSCHTSQWLYSEVKMIIDGHFMSELEMVRNDKPSMEDWLRAEDKAFPGAVAARTYENMVQQRIDTEH